jgi:hypothetical protein
VTDAAGVVGFGSAGTSEEQKMPSKLRTPKRVTRRKLDSRLALAATAAVLGGLACSRQAQATAFEWNLIGEGNWDTATNWDPNGIPDGAGAGFDSTTFNKTGVNGNVTVHTNSADRVTAGMTFNNTGTTNIMGGATGTPTTATTLLHTRGGFTFAAGAGAVNIGVDPDLVANQDSTGAVLNQLTIIPTSSFTFTNDSSNAAIIWGNFNSPRLQRHHANDDARRQRQPRRLPRHHRQRQQRPGRHRQERHRHLGTGQQYLHLGHHPQPGHAPAGQQQRLRQLHRRHHRQQATHHQRRLAGGRRRQ